MDPDRGDKIDGVTMGTVVTGMPGEMGVTGVKGRRRG